MLTGCSEAVSAIPAVSAASSPATSPPASQPATVSPAAQAVGTVLRSVRISPANAIDAAAAGAGALYVALQQGDGGSRWTIERADLATGRITKGTVTLPFLSTLTLGPHGLYVTTSVIDKYGRKPDTILRLNATTLRVAARRSIDGGALWDGAVKVAAHGDLLAEADGGGDVRLLDPVTLATRTSARVLSTGDLQAGDGIESPTIFGGRLWVLARHDLISFDLGTLAVRSEQPQGPFSQIVETQDGLELVGTGVASVTNRGAVVPKPTVPGVDGEGSQRAFGLQSTVLEQTNGVAPTILIRSLDGRVLRAMSLDHGTGLLLAATSTTAWVEGVPGHVGAVTALRLG